MECFLFSLSGMENIAAEAPWPRESVAVFRANQFASSSTQSSVLLAPRRRKNLRFRGSFVKRKPSCTRKANGPPFGWHELISWHAAP